MLKFINWNVNGIRAALKKGFLDYFNSSDADFFCLQETKCQTGQVELDLPGYRQFWNEAVRKGYSGTAVFTRHEPLDVRMGLGITEHDNEGRVITLEYPGFFLVTVYTPNAKSELERLDYRMVWEDDFRAYLKTLEQQKPVIFCGDLNVAHREIDLKNPKTNQRSAGFTVEERGKMQELIDAGFVDTFRHFYPDRTGAYTWWSYFGKARQNNAGWRIDYFMASESLRPLMLDAGIDDHILGSDHCPVFLHMDDRLMPGR